MGDKNYNPFEEVDIEGEDEDLIVSECKCDQCGAMFILPPDTELDKCPVCGTIYD